MQENRKVVSVASFRFRRWSRNGAASFRSLKYNVVIGCLSKAILSRIEKKNGNLITSIGATPTLLTEYRGVEEDLFLSLPLWVSPLLMAQTKEREAVCLPPYICIQTIS